MSFRSGVNLRLVEFAYFAPAPALSCFSHLLLSSSHAPSGAARLNYFAMFGSSFDILTGGRIFLALRRRQFVQLNNPCFSRYSVARGSSSRLADLGSKCGFPWFSLISSAILRIRNGSVPMSM